MPETLLHNKKVDKELEKVLRKNINFFWQYNEERWGEFSEDDLKRLVLLVATEIGITQEQAAQIHVTFGDNFSIHTDEKSYSNWAVCIADHDEQGKYTKNRVFLDRMQSIKSYGSKVNLGDYSSHNVIELRSTLEFLIWIVVEELNHAKINIKDATKQDSLLRQSKYELVIAKRNKIIQDDYDKSLHEMTALREVLRTLIKFFTPTYPQRAEYFRNFYERLKKTDQHMVLSPENIPSVPFWNWESIKLNPFQRWMRNRKLKRVAE